jgi:hypothetical protein
MEAHRGGHKSTGFGSTALAETASVATIGPMGD